MATVPSITKEVKNWELFSHEVDKDEGIRVTFTANFLHMAMTAILASSAFEFANRGDSYAPVFSKTAIQVIVLHGAYDFFITHAKIGGGYLSMTVFFFLVNQMSQSRDPCGRHWIGVDAVRDELRSRFNRYRTSIAGM